MTRLRIAIVGCGRTGSSVARSLVKTGLQRIALIDPDRVEPHNLGEMDGVGIHDIGGFKASALHASLEREGLLEGPTVCAISESVTSFSPLSAIKHADLLVCCVDNVSARLSTAILAKLYLKPLVDIGTGVLRLAGGIRIGADVRLVLPDRCLLCFGGIPGLTSAWSTTISASSRAPSEPGDWRRERAGSLRSLNQQAVGSALQMIEGLVSGRISASAWSHQSQSSSGVPVAEERFPPAQRACTLCYSGGQGDDGLKLARSSLWDET